MQHNIIALDPGKVTGIARKLGNEVEFHEMDFDNTCKYVYDTIALTAPDIYVVSEAFIITQHTAKNTQAPWSLELIGVFRYLSRTMAGSDVILQTPSAAKRFSSDERLKHMHYWTPGKGHANDAARHLLLFEATRGLMDREYLAELVAQ